MLSFGFVSGHDFSRAVEDRKRTGLQPLLICLLHERPRGYNKAQILQILTARLKSGPNTKHQTRDCGKVAPWTRLTLRRPNGTDWSSYMGRSGLQTARRLGTGRVRRKWWSCRAADPR